MADALSPAQKFRVRAALSERGVSFALSRIEALELARAWEDAERADRAEQFYLAELQRMRQIHADILEKSQNLLDAAAKLRRRFALALTVAFGAGVFVGAAILGAAL